MKWVKILHSLPGAGVAFAHLEELPMPEDIPLTPDLDLPHPIASLAESYAKVGAAAANVSHATQLLTQLAAAEADILEDEDGAEAATDFAEYMASFGLDLTAVKVDHQGHGAMSQLHLTFDFSPGTPDPVVSALVAYLQETT